MSDFVPNENQQKMLTHLLDTSEGQPKDITQEFPMRSNGDTQERQNYIDYLELWTEGLIVSRHAEWITNNGIVAVSNRALRSPINVEG